MRRPSLDLATLLGNSPTLYPLRHELVVLPVSIGNIDCHPQPQALRRPSLELATLLGRSSMLYPLRHELVVLPVSIGNIDIVIITQPYRNIDAAAPEPRTRDLVGQKSNALPTAPRARCLAGCDRED
ncbi:unnamed protein product [Schistocephalus solidus]|uniref:Uncharacterized protein n=1 Tax=Schistocephalus solidus TaxID=70667 RepID=A0A3P7BNC7_SCHSO|nr:unnamed protein product [Schistocephalus solidus]